MNLRPEIEFASAKEIEEFQTERLRDLLGHVLRYSPFYQRRYAEYGVSLNAVTRLGDIRRLPVTTKEDLRAFNWDFLCVPQDQVADLSTTSGTTGQPVTIALSRSDLKRLAYNEAISFTCADASASDRFQLMLTLDRQFMAGLAYFEGVRMLGGGVVRVGPGFPAQQWDAIHRLHPTTLVAVPSFIVKLLEYAESHNYNVSNSSVEKIICIGENIRTIDLRPNAMAKRIRSQWEVNLYGTYASTEMQTAFTECRCGIGGHHHPELVIIELLDNSDQPAGEGEPGEVTITTLGVEAMPLIRFKTGDIARVHKGRCPCGRNTLRLGPVEGRKNQMIKLKGTSLYPPAIVEIIHDFPAIQDYAIEVLHSDLGTDDLLIHIVADSANHSEINDELTEMFRSRLRVKPRIGFVQLQEMRRLLGSAEGRKQNRFIDSRIN